MAHSCVARRFSKAPCACLHTLTRVCSDTLRPNEAWGAGGLIPTFSSPLSRIFVNPSLVLLWL